MKRANFYLTPTFLGGPSKLDFKILKQKNLESISGDIPYFRAITHKYSPIQQVYSAREVQEML
jgi:hypothetical protein